MCGIAGIINLFKSPVNEYLIAEMIDLINHRGPDGYGYYFHENIAFGHKRLSIIDLTDGGSQPMFYQNKYVIIYNGEIYNYLEIREELKTLGYQFGSNSDTEVILAAYDKWGKDCVNKFNGMWAFAIHDKVRNLIFCSRDRFGVKPFYYHQGSALFCFGSEIKQLTGFLSKRIVNKKILMDYLVLSIEDHNEETFFEGIYKLQPAHNLFFDLNTNAISLERYYSIKIDKKYSQLEEKEAIKLYKQELERSIQYRLRSDVKVATCLSGGVDSSSIASVAAILYKNASGNNFSAITAKSTDINTDETNYAQMVADKSELDWHVVEPTTKDFLNVVDKVIRTQEEPFGSPSIIMQYFVFEKAKEIKCPVMLDGQGGDETLLGYERYYPAYLLSLSWYKRILEFINSSKNSKLSKKDLFLYFLYFTNADIRLKRQLIKNQYIKSKYLSLIDKDLVRKMADSYSDISKLQLLELSQTQLPHLLKYEDKNSMQHSIETRLPFLDYKLLELSISINNNLKIKKGWTKYILRRSTEEKLPKEVIWRKNKFGFEAPSKEWLKNKDIFNMQIKKSKILKEIFLKEFNGTNDVNLLWKLYNIARWEEIYEVEIISENDCNN